MRVHKSILFSHHQFNTRLRYVHKFHEILDYLGVEIVKGMKVIQPLKLPIDCNMGRGDGSRKSHLKLCYQILHEIRVPWLLAYSTAINVLCDTFMAFLRYF